MQTAITFALVALMIPAGAQALEAVAQGSVGAGSASAAQNLALETKVTQQAAQGAALGALFQELRTELNDTRAELEHLKAEMQGGMESIISSISSTLSAGSKFSDYEFRSGPRVANCSAGKKVLGGGCAGSCGYSSFAVDGNSAGSSLNPVFGFPSQTSYHCNCDGGPYGGIWNPDTIAYVICAKVD